MGWGWGGGGNLLFIDKNRKGINFLKCFILKRWGWGGGWDGGEDRCSIDIIDF